MRLLRIDAIEGKEERQTAIMTSGAFPLHSDPSTERKGQMGSFLVTVENEEKKGDEVKKKKKKKRGERGEGSEDQLRVLS